MKAFVVLALCLAVGVCMVSAAGDPTEKLPGVFDLTPDDFDKHVNGAKHALVEFYAPWCGHCKHMVPEYKSLGEMVQADPVLKSRVVVAKVNADAHRELGTRFDVHGFPTIKFFPRGKKPSKETAMPYESARSADKFLEFLKQKLEEDKGFARVAELDKLAQKFVAAEKKGKDAVAKEVEAAVGKLKDEAKENGKVYASVIKKALEKGDDYFKTELARLERMIASGSVKAEKLDAFSKKASVLGAFTEKASADNDDVDEE
eukprot:gene6246-6482_t